MWDVHWVTYQVSLIWDVLYKIFVNEMAACLFCHNTDDVMHLIYKGAVTLLISDNSHYRICDKYRKSS